MKPPLRAILADDEPLARSYLRELLAAHPDVAILAECRNGLEAARAIAQHRPELAFLDIEMPKLDGFEVLDLAEAPLAVVFVTAFDHYAVRAFEAHAVDYLQKPFSAERLAAALQRVQQRIGVPRVLDANLLRREAFPDRPFAQRLAVKNGADIVLIEAADLDYATSEDDYVNLHVGAKSWLKHQSLASLEQTLDPRHFVRIHRTCLVNVERVARMEQETRDTWTVVLRGRTELRATRQGYLRLRAVLGV